MVDLKPISEAIRPLCILNWMLGMGVIRYPIGQPHPIISFINSSMHIVVYCVLAYIAYPLILEQSNISISKVPLKILFYSSIFLTISHIGLAWYRNEEIYKCLSMSAFSDHQMEEIGISIDYTRMSKAHLRKIFIAFLFILIIFGAIVGSQTTPLSTRVIPTIVMFYPVMIMLIGDATYLACVSCSSYRFNELNQLLKSMITTSVDYPQHKRIVCPQNENEKKMSIPIETLTIESMTKKQAILIKSVKEIHLILVKICHEANSNYGLQILLSIVVAFSIVTGNLYNIYLIVNGHNISLQIIQNIIFTSGIWVIYYTAKISIISWVCNDCINNNVKTGDLINEYYDEPVVDSDTQTEIRDFNLQLIKTPLKFTAAGFVNVDLTLMQVLLPTMTTYLTILLKTF